MLGDQLNMLPILLLVLSGFSIQKEFVESGRWPIGMIAFTLIIVLVFYSFCAAIVLYWAVINAVQLVERSVFGRLDSLECKGDET